MKSNAKHFILIATAIFSTALIIYLMPNRSRAQEFQPLPQWVASTSPATSITQRTYGKNVRITGLTASNCVQTDTNDILTSSGSSCGSDTFSWPFTPQSWGNSTSTVLGFLNGFFSDASSTVASTTFLANGNVGIGTTSPATTLSVAGNGYFTGGLGVGVENTSAGSVLTSSNGSYGFAGQNGTLSASGLNNLAASVHLNVGYGLWIRDAGSGHTRGLDQSGGNSNNLGIFENSAEDMTINTNGDVGIGTTSPGVPLHVQGATIYKSSNTTLALDSGAAGTPTSMELLNGDVLKWLISSRGTVDTPNNRLSFFSGGSTETLTLTSSGSTGIGSTSPWRTLDVNGTVSFKGLTTSAANQSAYLCLSANNEVISDSGTCLVSNSEFKNSISTSTGMLTEALKLRPVNFYYNLTGNTLFDNNPNYIEQHFGFVAQEVAAVDPRLVEWFLTPVSTTTVVVNTTLTASGTSKISYSTSTSIISYTASSTPRTVRYEEMIALLDGAIKDFWGIFTSIFRLQGNHLTGITIYDTITGNPYCIQVASGVTATLSGACQ